MNNARRIRVCGLFAAGFLGLAGAARADECPAAKLPPIDAPYVRAALVADRPVVIVAIGSSSTQSWMASDEAHSYPAILQNSLESAWPHAHVAVIDRGIGGQDAAEEVTRLETDALAVHPQAVIWQVGANGVLRNTDIAVFRKLVSAGLDRLKAAKLDVILMDNQRAPRILESPRHLLVDQALVDMAAEQRVGLFARGKLMDAWEQAGAPYARFVSPDGLHHNDLGYRCMAEALAGAIVSGVGPLPIGAAAAPIGVVVAAKGK